VLDKVCAQIATPKESLRALVAHKALQSVLTQLAGMVLQKLEIEKPRVAALADMRGV